MALIIRSWSDLGQWWGVPAMISSLFGLLFVAILQRAAPNLINRALSDPGSQAGDIDAIYSILTDITHRVFENSAAHLFITFIVGAGVFGSIWAWSRRHTAVEPDVSTRQLIEEREMDQSPANEEDPPPPGFSSPPPVKPFNPEGLSNQEE